VLRSIRKKLHPAWFQGCTGIRGYFEGWYYKLVSKDGTRLLAVIPGVYLSDTPGQSHCFIQVFNGKTNETSYTQYPLKEFSAESKDFNITIADSRFTQDHMSLHVKKNDVMLSGELEFSGQVEWPRTLLSPGIMGWYTWAPRMECYHGVISLDHSINGSIDINGETADFSEGRGYIEKDWGRSFPKAWLWFQTNHFYDQGTGFMGSAAVIPWMGTSFTGVIFGLYHKGRLYRFTTYLGARLTDLTVESGSVTCIIKQKPYILHVKAARAAGGYLKAPALNGMTHIISESMQSEIEVKVEEQTGNSTRIVFHGKGVYAGFEMAGDTDLLCAVSSLRGDIKL